MSQRPTPAGPFLPQPADSELLATWSDDGRWLATALVNGVVRVFDGASLAAVARLHGPDTTQALAFSPDGSCLATRGSDGIVRLWELPSGALRHALPGANTHGMILTFSEDGARVAAGDDEGVVVWSTRTGTCERQIDAAVADLVWVRGELWAASLDGERRSLDADVSHRPAEPFDRLAYETALAHDGTHAAPTGSGSIRFTRLDGTSRTLDLETMWAVRRVRAGFLVLRSLRPSPSAANADHPVCLVRTPELTLEPLPVPSSERGVWEAAVHPTDGTTVVKNARRTRVWKGNGTVAPLTRGASEPPFVSESMEAHLGAHVLDLRTGRVLHGVTPVRWFHDDGPPCADGRHRVRRNPGEIAIVDSAGREVAHVSTPSDVVLHPSRDGARLAAVGQGQPLRVHDAATGAVLVELPTVDTLLTWFDPWRDELVTTSSDGAVHTWDLTPGAEVMSFELPDEAFPQALARTRDGRWILVCDEHVHVLDPHARPLGRAPCVHAWHLVAGEDAACTRSTDHTLRLWDLDTVTCRRIAGAVPGGWWAVDPITGVRDGNDAGLAALDEAERMARW